MAKNIRIKDEYDEIAELDAQLDSTTGYNRKKQNRKDLLNNIYNGIIGLAKLLAVLSIAYSTYHIIRSSEDLASKILIIPQVLLATYFAVDAFVVGNTNSKRGKK